MMAYIDPKTGGMLFQALAAWQYRHKVKDKGTLCLVPFFAILALVSVILSLGKDAPISRSCSATCRALTSFRHMPGS